MDHVWISYIQIMDKWYTNNVYSQTMYTYRYTKFIHSCRTTWITELTMFPEFDTTRFKQKLTSLLPYQRS
jgi:hypothetical protein